MVNQRVHKALLPAQKDSCAQNGARLGWGTMVRKKILQKYQPLIQCWLDWHKQSLKKRNATSPHSWHKSRKPHSILLFRLAHRSVPLSWSTVYGGGDATYLPPNFKKRETKKMCARCKLCMWFINALWPWSMLRWQRRQICRTAILNQPWHKHQAHRVHREHTTQAHWTHYRCVS